MEVPPQPQYRIVSRDGQLVVEKVGKTLPPPPRKPWLKLPPISWRDIGRKLFRRQRAVDLTEDGDAILSASQLADYLTLDARSYDLYYVTPEQQALLGWIGITKYLFLAWIVVMFGIFDVAGGGGIFVHGFFLALGFAIWKAFESTIEAIHCQRIEEEPPVQPPA